MTVFGNPARFAISFELRPFPDVGGTERARRSWGDLMICVAGRNLTSGTATSGGMTDRAQVPLLPVIEWIVRNWDALLHEERLPRPARVGSAAEWRCSSLQFLPAEENDLDSLLADREQWWERHGLGAALPGFRVPDLHIRRLGDMIELSWDDREWRALPHGVQLLERPGAAILPIEEVADPILGACRAMRDALAGIPALAEDVAALGESLSALGSPARALVRAELAVGPSLRRGATQLRELLNLTTRSVDETMDVLLGAGRAESSVHYVSSLPVPALLLRCANPALTESDLIALLALLRELPAGVSAIEQFRRTAHLPASSAEITHQGYALALEFRAGLGLDPALPLTGEADIQAMIENALGVLVRETRLDDASIDGAAVSRPGARAMIAVNRSGRFARSQTRRRMTLAHELCHLLHDFTAEGTVGVVSNPWAAYPMERRANAFAAMLLAPEPAIDALLPRDSGAWTVPHLRAAMGVLGVGVSTLTWHLHNLGWISEVERRAWVDELIVQ